MILTLHVPGTTVKRVQETLKIHVPPMQGGETQGEQEEAEAIPPEPENVTHKAATGEGLSGQEGDSDGADEKVGALSDARGYSFQVSVSQLTSVVGSGNISITIPV